MNESSSSLVTGGAGFIGSHLCKELLKRGQKVICLDNLITGSRNNINFLLANPNFQFIEYDITKPLPANFKIKFSKLNFLYHLASPASPKKYQKYSRETLLVNSIGTYHMLKLAYDTNSRFLLASTSEIYGDPQIHPQKETYWGNVNPVGPRSCYDEGKRFAESLTMDFIRKDKLDALIVRIFNTYGPNMEVDDGRVISNFISQSLLGKPLTIYGDGSQTRSFCYVTDLVDGIIKLMEKSDLKDNIFNLGNPDERTIIELAKAILKLTRSKSPLLHSSLPIDDPIRRKPDITLVHRVVNWLPVTKLEVGLRSTIDYFRNIFMVRAIEP